MTRTVYVVLAETVPYGQSDASVSVLAIWSTEALADRFAERYQRSVGRRLVVFTEEWTVDDPGSDRMGEAA